MLSDVEEGNNLMLTIQTPVTTLHSVNLVDYENNAAFEPPNMFMFWSLVYAFFLHENSLQNHVRCFACRISLIVNLRDVLHLLLDFDGRKKVELLALYFCCDK